MKLLGQVLLTIGFLAGAFVTVQNEASVHWTSYGVCAGAMFFGLVFIRTANAAAADEVDHEAHSEVLDQSLDSLVTKLAALNAEQKSLDPYDVRHASTAT